MATFRGFNRRTRRVAAQVLLASVVVYFVYHALVGHRGWYAWQQLSEELATMKGLHAQLATERQEMEQRARLLRSDHLDPDMLEERARLLLNFGRPEDVIIYLPQNRSRW